MSVDLDGEHDQDVPHHGDEAEGPGDQGDEDHLHGFVRASRDDLDSAGVVAAAIDTAGVGREGIIGDIKPGTWKKKNTKIT